MFQLSTPTFWLSKERLHDTLLFADPNHDSLTITFPNFTSKFRAKNNYGKTKGMWVGFDAFPLFWRYDSKNLNPFFPFSSDSLSYFWDFDDPEAENCISTDSAPNPCWNYSREKIPTHIFKANGCFNVKFTSADTVTGCSNTATQPIVFEKPLASYDTSKYYEINWYKQQDIIAKTGSLEGLGLVLGGRPCAHSNWGPRPTVQGQLNLYYEGLEPSCKILDYEVLFDAEKDCAGKKHIRDNNGQIIDSIYTNCQFLPQIVTRILGQNWNYVEPGWKTLVMVVFNGYSRDTFFYKDYIYIKDLNVNLIVQNGILDSENQKMSFVFKNKDTINRELDSITRLEHTLIQIATPHGSTHREIFKDSMELLPNGFVDFGDSSTTLLSSGKYFAGSNAENTHGCLGQASQEISVEHLATFRIKQACAGGKTQFYDSVYYWNPGGQLWC